LRESKKTYDVALAKLKKLVDGGVTDTVIKAGVVYPADAILK
jgi:hypothetical protein